MKKTVFSGIQKKKKEKNQDFYFKDCYICQQTNKAEEEGRNLSAEELKKVFQKANEQN